MLDRLIQLMLRLKDIFASIEVRETEAHGNDATVAALNEELTNLKQDQSDAMKVLDELEVMIKKWE